jgi:MinD superfamily P-loop ATPase
VVGINKYTINKDNTRKIEQYCKEREIDFVGKIPYDVTMTEAMVNEKSVMEFSDSDLANRITDMWSKVKRRLLE